MTSSDVITPTDGESAVCPLCGRGASSSLGIFTQEASGARECQAFVCGVCELIWLRDYRDSREEVYGAGYAAWGEGVGDEDVIAASKRAAFARQLRPLAALLPNRGRLLDIGTGVGYLMDEAEKLGFEAYGVDLSEYAVKKAAERHPGRVAAGTVEDIGYPKEHFDAVTMTDLIEHVPDPLETLRAAHGLLRPGGALLIITPDITDLTRRLMGSRWMQYKHEHVIYWSPKAITTALERCGFGDVRVRHNWKAFSPSYYAAYFRKYALLGEVGKALVRLHDLLPKRLQTLPFPNPITGEMLVTARKKT